jgi:hypothetical protein
MRVQDDGDRGVLFLLRVIAAFKPAFGAGKMTSGMGSLALPGRPRFLDEIRQAPLELF